MGHERTSVGSFTKRIPWNHFGRKNLGYLFAIGQNARHIFDFDDDNELKYGTFPLVERPSNSLADAVKLKNETVTAFNPYPLMGSTSESAWPRGFPLPSITEHDSYAAEILPAHVDWDTLGVFQAVADHDPDVDAIYRMTVRELHFTFDPTRKPAAIPV